MSHLFIFLLCVDAAIVFTGLLQHHDMWFYIVGYWLVLTIKNLYDLIKARKGENHSSTQSQGGDSKNES